MVYFVSTDKSRSRRPRRRNAEINITNLMDVMMVLLVVFMVAAPLMTSGIALNLPKVGGQNLTGKETSLNISVDSDGFYYIGKEEIPAEKIVERAIAEQADFIGLSGLITPSLEEMCHVVSEMEKAGLRTR